MPDERGNEKKTEDATDETSLHAYKDGREEDVEGSIPDGDKGARDVTETGGATSGGPPAALGEEAESADDAEESDRGETADETPEPEEGSGEKGLGSESGGSGGASSPPNNPDSSTKGATKGTEGAV